ncbi:peptide-binding protein [bacterium]|nr:peptide-binding protein [bacterium]
MIDNTNNRKALRLARVFALVAILLIHTFEAIAANRTFHSLPSYGGTLVVGMTNDVDTLNPLFGETSTSQEVTHLLLLGLADLNDKSEFEPELASSWQRSEDYLKVTYRLRKDAIWSDGVPVTAEDVKFTWDLLMDKTLGSPRQAVTEFVKSVTVEGQHTVTFEFFKAYPDQIFDTAGEILPKHILEGIAPSELRAHAFARKPISSGPFLLNKWIGQQYIELIPNEKYFGGRPYLDRIIFKIVPDNTNLLLQLQSGEVDMVVGIPPEEASQLKQTNAGIEFYPVSGRVYHFMGYNLNDPLFATKTVRQALTMAIDRHSIIMALLSGTGSACLGPLPPMLTWVYDHAAKELPFEPETAEELLAQQGWQDRDGDGWLDKDGKLFEFKLKAGSGNQLRSDTAVIIQDQLKRIGVKVQIATMERTALLQDLRAKKFQAVMGGWSTSFNMDPTPIFHSSATELFNFGSYANPKVDKLIEQGREEMDRKKAAAIWQEMQKLIYEDQPYTFLFWQDRLVAVNRQFKNVTPIALSAFYNLERWYHSPN